MPDMTAAMLTAVEARFSTSRSSAAAPPATSSEDAAVVLLDTGFQSGVRSLDAAVVLLDTGFKYIKNMAGGYAKWVENGYLVEKHEETEVNHGETEAKKHEELK